MYQPYEVWKISNILKAIFVIYDQIVSMVIKISYRCVPEGLWAAVAPVPHWQYFDRMLVLEMYLADHNEILHTSRQWHCRDVCKIPLWSVGHILNQSAANFYQISNWIEISLVG